jgi:hypothetical protein
MEYGVSNAARNFELPPTNTSLGSPLFFVSLFQCVSKLVDAKAQSLTVSIKLYSRRDSPCCQGNLLCTLKLKVVYVFFKSDFLQNAILENPWLERFVLQSRQLKLFRSLVV